MAMAPRRRSESRAVKLATSAAIFVLSANVAYQVSQSLGRPAPAPPVARADPDHRLGAHHLGAELKHLHLRPRHGAHGDHAVHEASSRAEVESRSRWDREAEEEGLFHDDHGNHPRYDGASASDASDVEREASEKGSGIHVLATSNGSPYLNWQTRVMYKTFKDVAKGSDMRHFTRLLHRRSDDELMGEVPTVRVDSLHAECDTWCEFPVADRPDALRKWLETEDSKRGEWIVMIETDYVWRKALKLPPPGASAVAFHFHYINPNYPTLPDVMTRLMPPEKRDRIKMEDIICSGPAPTMIRKTELDTLIDEYVRIAAAIEADPDAKKKLGWVREMYAYDLAAAVTGVPHRVEDPGQTSLIAQPPADTNHGDAAMFHYTWGAEYLDRNKQKVWSWDKRPYVETRQVRDPARFKPELPPADAADRGLKLQDGKPVTAELNEVMTEMLALVRDAIDALDVLPHEPGCGWEQNEPKCDFGCETGVLCVPTKNAPWRA